MGGLNFEGMLGVQSVSKIDIKINIFISQIVSDFTVISVTVNQLGDCMCLEVHQCINAIDIV